MFVMFRNVRQTHSAIAVAALLIFATTGQYAFGDVIRSDIAVDNAGLLEVTAGDSGETLYFVQNAGDCDPVADGPVTFSINIPGVTGLSRDPTSLTIAGCGTGNGDMVTFYTTSSTPAGSYEITITVTDANGGTYSTSPAKFNLQVNEATDTTAPEISYTINGVYPPAPDGNNGWYITDAFLSWTVSEPESPGTLVLTGCEDIIVNYDTSGDTFSCEATSDGGTAGPVEVTIMRDTSPPTATHTLVPATPDGDNDWYVSEVDLSWQYDDDISGINDASTVGCVDQTLNTDFDTTTFSCEVTNNAGLSNSDSVNIKRDASDPTITGSATPAANSNGWNNEDVTISFECDDETSGIASCEGSIMLSAETTTSGTSITGTATDNAGNTNTYDLDPIKIDKTDPTIAGSRTPVANGFGWNNGPVDVEFICSDELSGIDLCGPNTALSTEGAGQSATGTALDLAGNTATATVSDINIDLTYPFNVAFVGGEIVDGGVYYFGFVPSGPASCTADDSLSGFEHCDVTGGGVSVGSHSYTATAYDEAGNSAVHTISYTVNAWTLAGFFQPVEMEGTFNVIKGGQTVPLKFKIFAGATELTDAAYVDSLKYKKIACPSNGEFDPIEGDALATGGTILRYDADSGQFVYNWKTPTNKNTCWEVTLTTDDGSTLKAKFQTK